MLEGETVTFLSYMELELDIGFISPASTARLSSISTFQRSRGPVPDHAMVEALKSPARKVCSQKSQPASGEKGMSREEVLESMLQNVFGDPTEMWDKRQNTRTRRSLDLRPNMSNDPLWLNNRHKSAWVGLQRGALDGEVKTPSKVVSASYEGHCTMQKLEPHDCSLEVGMSRKLCENGRISDAVDALNFHVKKGCRIDNNLFYVVLKRCVAHNDLVMGRHIHTLAIESGYEGNAFLATHLISLYASHGRLEEAMQVFTKVSVPTVYNWTTIIFACARHGKPVQAILLYRQMLDSTTIKPDNRLFVAVLKACAIAGDLVAGKEVHAHLLAIPGKPDIFVQAGLVSMYAKCGSLVDARRIFDRLPERNVVIWNSLLAGYAQQGMGQEALSLYSQMQQEGSTAPDCVTYVCLLQACASVGAGAVTLGKKLHAQIEERGFQVDLVLCRSLVNMYAKCGSFENARKVFDRLPKMDVMTWNVLIGGYAQQGMGQEALGLYSRMVQGGLTTPNCVTYVCLLQACASVGVDAAERGKQLHAEIEQQGLHEDLVLGVSLVSMYVKCGRLGDACRVFDRLPEREVVTWNALLTGYAQLGMGHEALSLYSRMQEDSSTAPDSVTYVCLLQACASVGEGALDQGKQLHAEIGERGLQEDLVLGGSLVNMYAKCSSLGDARRVFDKLPKRNVVTWNALFAGYAQQGLGHEALSLYRQMQDDSSMAADCVTYMCLLQACASVGALDQGKQLHKEIARQGLDEDVVLGGSLVNMYAKCGSLGDARNVFDRLPERNVVTWNAVLAGYVQQGKGKEALSLYSRMQKEGNTAPDSATYVCLLQACAFVAALPLAKQLHTQVKERGLQSDLAVGAGLVNMYAKCGSMFDSQQVFDSFPEKSIEAWNALTSGYARLGESKVVFNLLDRMKLEGIQPDGTTFLSLMTVCSHVGQVHKGWKYFEAMKLDYGISPTIEHYTCMIDLLGRAGHLQEAVRVAKTMPFLPTVAVWRTLLGACRKWKNVEIGEQAFELAVTEDDRDASTYALMSNIYASAKMWEAAKEIQARRVKSGASKKAGQSWWTDVGGVVHTFVVGDKRHPEGEGIDFKACTTSAQYEKDRIYAEASLVTAGHSPF